MAGTETGPRAKRRKRVFILGGGATLGAHQVGAIKFLEEQGIRPDAIVGSSIGVINACVYCSGGISRLEEAWRDFRSLQQVLRPSLTHNPIVGLSLFSMTGLSRALETFIDFPRVFESDVEVAFVVLNLSRARGEIYRRRDLADWRELRTISRAGYAIPLLFPPVRFKDEYLVDGGFAWNIPLEYALAMGATEIYILAPIPSQLPFQSRLPSFVHLASRFVDVMWRTIGNMGYLYARLDHGRFNGVPVTIIEPGEEFSGFRLLDLFHTHPAKSRRLMAAGYRDAKRIWAAQQRSRRAAARSASDAAHVA